jgi:hypothetical protein
VKLVIDDEIGRRAMEEVGGRVDEEVFLDPEGTVRDTSGGRDLGERDVVRLVDKILADSDLVDEGGGDELAEDLQLQGGRTSAKHQRRVEDKAKTNLSLVGRRKLRDKASVNAGES